MMEPTNRPKIFFWHSPLLRKEPLLPSPGSLTVVAERSVPLPPVSCSLLLFLVVTEARAQHRAQEIAANNLYVSARTSHAPPHPPHHGPHEFGGAMGQTARSASSTASASLKDKVETLFDDENLRSGLLHACHERPALASL